MATSAFVRDLGFAIDADLSMAAQIANACLSAYYHLYRISHIRHTLTTCTTKCLVHALVTSRIDYDNAMMYGIPDRLLHRLELMQHSAAKVFCRVSICCDFASHVCKVLNVFQSITIVYVVYGDGVICLVVDPLQFVFCCVELCYLNNIAALIMEPHCGIFRVRVLALFALHDEKRLESCGG